MTEPRDARSLDHATLEELRRLAVRRVLEGQTQQEVARTLQVHFVTVCRWVGAYREGGESELAGTKAPGPEPKLTERQTERLRRTILGKNPQQLNFGPALWTLRLVEEVIRKLFRVVLHKSTIGRLLHRLGLTSQKPIRRAFRKRPTVHVLPTL